MTKIITVEKEKQFVIDLLTKEEITKEDASLVADVLAAADVRGTKTHGLSRIQKYIERVSQGLIEPKGKLEEVQSKNNIVLFNGNNTLGQVAGYHAMNKAIELAKEFGVGIVGTGNTNHFGIGAFYSMMASSQNLIGFVCTNTSPLMAPFGGKDAMLGTNPFSVAIPSNKYDDIVLDLATSEVARGKIEVAAREGNDIPLGWALDTNGKPTTDANKGLEGTVTPVGGPKGYGMAMIVDILAGVLTQSAFLDDVGSLSLRNKKQDLGFFMVAFDPSLFIETSQFKQIIDDYIERIKGSSKAEGVEEIFLPGEIEAKAARENEKSGIEITDKLYNSLCDLAGEYNIDFSKYVS